MNVMQGPCLPLPLLDVNSHQDYAKLIIELRFKIQKVARRSGEQNARLYGPS